MMDTRYPAAVNVRASCQTRRSNGHGRFSTMIRTRRPCPAITAAELTACWSTAIAPSSPANAAILRVVRLAIGQSYDVEQQLIRARVRLESRERFRRLA